MGNKTYTTYIITNADRTVLYTGVTNDLRRRLIEHWVGKEGSFTTRYQVYYLVCSEETRYILNAIALEKEIKLLNRLKKEQMITCANPEWKSGNKECVGHWPPTDQDIDAVRMHLMSNPSADTWI